MKTEYGVWMDDLATTPAQRRRAFLIRLLVELAVLVLFFSVAVWFARRLFHA